MAVDWSKYGVKTNQQTEKTPLSSVDWDKYKSPAPAEKSPVTRKPQIVPTGTIGRVPDDLISAEDVMSGKVDRPDLRKVIEEGARKGPQRSLANRFGKAGSDFVMRTVNRAALGLPFAVLPGGEQAREETDTTAGRVGDIAGELVGFGKAYQLTRGLANAAIKKGAGRAVEREFATKGIHAPRAAQEFVRGGIAEGAFATGKEAADVVFDTRQDEGQSIGERVQNVATQTALGAVGDAALGGLASAAAPLIRQGRNRLALRGEVNDFIQRTKQTDTGPVEGARGLTDSLKTDTKSQLVTKLDKEPFSAAQKANQLYIDYVDDLQRINQFDKVVENTLGKLKPTDRPYDLALASRGSDIISNQILTQNLVDSAGNVTGKSLKGVLRSLPEGSYKEFEDYLINRHAITRGARGEKVFDDSLKWSPQKGMEIVSQYEAQYPEFRQIADDYYNFNHNMVKNWLIDTGLLTRQQAAQWVTENPFYVPMKRQFSDLEKTGRTGTKRGFADQKAPVKAYSKTGSQRKIYSPIESTIENVDAFVKAAKRNQVMQAMVRNIQQNPEDFKEWAEIVPVREDVTASTLKDINKTLSEDGIDGLVQRMNDEFEMTFRKSPNQGLDKDNIVKTVVNGQPVHVKINDRQLLDALQSLNPEGQNVLLDFLGQITRFFKIVTTGANPIFGLTRNLSRDFIQAFIANRNSPGAFAFTKDYLENFVRILKNDAVYQSYKNIGGGHASPAAADRNLLAQSKRAILPQNRLSALGPRVFSGIENFMNALESVPRLGEFKRAGMGDADQKLKGLLDAQDVTVNFKRKGRIGRQVDKVFPYFNAAIQGLDKIARLYRDNPVKAFARTAMSITVPTIGLYALNYDNPDFQKVSKYVRDNYFLIPKGDGTFWRVAKPRELGIPFSASIERLLDQWLKEDPEAFRGFADAVRVAFLPPGVSGAAESGSLTDRLIGFGRDTIAGPVVDLAKNETFTGAPIVPANLERLSPELQFDERTSEVSKFLGKLTGTSPKQLDHLIRSYTGVVGQLGLPATTKGASVGEVLTRQVTTDPVYSNDIQNRFYEIKEKLDRAQSDFKATGQKSKSYSEDFRKVYSEVNQIMGELRAASRQIENSDLPRNQRKDFIREIRKRINDLAEKTNKVYRERTKK